MSQVVVTNDRLRQKRSHSLAQEQKIDRDSFLIKWQKSTSVTKPSILTKVIGFAALPVLGFWAFILLLLSICMAIFVGLLRGLGTLFGGIGKS